MNMYDYSTWLYALWQDAVKRYEAGERGADTFFDAATVADLAAVGLKPIEVYDFAEDFVKSGEPDFGTFLLICEARRDYFLHVQKGVPSSEVICMDSLPSKEDAVEGIVWLPRIMPKALAKLRGELEPDLMFCCGGDRRFFKENNIHPAEFLRVVWAWSETPEKIIAWVKERRAGKIIASEASVG